MKIRVVYTEKHKLHSDPYGLHPESPWRVEEVLRVLRSSEIQGFAELTEPPEPDYTVLRLVHDAEYVEWVQKECSKGFHYVDSDTYVTEHTCDIAASFATASRDAALRALNGEVTIILARPGGHHAGRRGRAMGAPTLGFCIFDYVSVAALELANRGVTVAVLDFDAHHGNGSQEILWNEPRVLHVDVHQWRIYPGTGWVTDIGGSGAEGSKINIPLHKGASDNEFTWVLERTVKPAMELFKPEVLVVFAGFDAHIKDPLAMLKATEKTYSLYGNYIKVLLKEGLVRGVVIILGGGYGEGLIEGFKSFTKALLGLEEKPEMEVISPGEYLERGISIALEKLRELTRRLSK